MVKKIKIFDPVVTKKEEDAIKKVLKNHQWAIGSGAGLVSKFEEKFNDFIGSTSCVAVDSGTAAIHLALSLIDVRGKEVILPSLCSVSVANAITINGGIPVFADVDPDTLCMTSEEISKKHSKKTKAVIPVHFAGFPCDLNKINDFCEGAKSNVIEDAALALGTTYKGKEIGSHSPFVCFSFHPVKNLAMPKGGAITLNGNKSTISEKILKSKRWCGIAKKSIQSYEVDPTGLNYYMNEFSAAIGLEQLKKLKKMINKRKTIAKKYSRKINLDTKMIFSNDCSFNFYWILVKRRNHLIKKLNEHGIECGIYHTPIHKFEYYKTTNLPNTDKISKELLCLPNHPNLNEMDVEKIINVVNRFV